MNYKKILIYCIFLFTNILFSAPVNEADRINDIQQRQFEQERIRQQQEKMQKEFENTKFDNSQIQIDNNIKSDDSNTNKFLIKIINLKDDDKLLSKREKDRIIEKYIYLELSSDDIRNLLTDITNKLISKGYTTSTVNFNKDNDLTTGTLNLEIPVMGLISTRNFLCFLKIREKFLISGTLTQLLITLTQSMPTI